MDTLRTNIRCPICGKHTFKMENDMEICPVCGWENDGVQMHNHKYAGGANKLSLDDYKEKYFASIREADE